MKERRRIFDLTPDEIAQERRIKQIVQAAFWLFIGVILGAILRDFL